MTEARWTAKLPALLLGFLLLVCGLVAFAWSKSRTAFIAGALLAAIGCAFVGYSMTLKEWCRQADHTSDLAIDFGSTLRGCLEAKGWIAL